MFNTKTSLVKVKFSRQKKNMEPISGEKGIQKCLGKWNHVPNI